MVLPRYVGGSEIKEAEPVSFSVLVGGKRSILFHVEFDSCELKLAFKLLDTDLYHHITLGSQEVIQLAKLLDLVQGFQ